MNTVWISYFQLSARAALLVACVTLIAACGQQPKQALHLNLKPGQNYVLSIRSTAESVSTQPDGTSQSRDGRYEFRFALHVEETNSEGNTVVLVQPQKARFMWFYGQINSAFESYSFRVQLTPVGRVAEFTGTDAMRDSVQEALLATAQSKGTTFPIDTMLEAVSDEALVALLEPVLAVWPSVPVAPGDKWTRESIYNPLGDTLERTQFTLTSLDGGAAVISMTSTIEPAGKKSALSVSGTASGELRISTSDGTIRAYRSTQSLEGSTKDPDTGATVTFTSTGETQAELTAR